MGLTERSCAWVDCGVAVITRPSSPERGENEATQWSAEFLVPHWYAAYTCARHEKRVTEHLAERHVQHFLPQFESVRRWNDRQVKLNLPLFPGYVFVQLALRDRLRVLQIPGIVRLVGFNGHPVALPDQEIDALRNTVAARLRAEPHSYLIVGRRVRIMRGPLEGAQGILVRKKSTLRVVLSLDLIARSAAVEVDAEDIEPIS